MTFRTPLVIAVLLAMAAPLNLPAADVAPGAKPNKQNSLIDPPDVALRKFTVAPGLKIDLFAAEPDVRNPVALSIDERGRVFLVESDRRRSSVFDIRGHREWLEADFSFRSVKERADFLQREVVPANKAAIERLTKGGRGDFQDFNHDGVIDWRDLEVQSERIRLLEDTNGDGRADRVSVFADGFTNIAAGVAAGVLARGNDVYFACIPDLWKFTNYDLRLTRPQTSATPVADSALVNRKSEIVNLLSGFGVHIAFGGHDMHGLIFGPDGKLYWSIADRGTDTNLFAKIKNPIPGLTPELLADSGCIFRANPDGSDFEVIAWGLRNPQELAFDEYGNLFTADNNGDGGDKARWHYVVEGADFGWRIGWQWLEARAYQPKMGPWNGERLWHLAESNTAAYLLPPLAHIGHGPAGLAYNPGTGLPPQFDRHFFLCDFPGHVLMWTNILDGASFKVGPVQNFFGDLGPTDVAFHPDGGVLVSDWFKSFDKSDKGRIYRIHDPATDASKAVQETKQLLARSLRSSELYPSALRSKLAGILNETAPTTTQRRAEKQLVTLLSHPDARVREASLDELVDWDIRISLKGLRAGERPLLETMRNGETPMARIQALWGLQRVELFFREMKEKAAPLSAHTQQAAPFLTLLSAGDDEIRSQAANALGQIGATVAVQPLSRLLNEANSRTRFHAAQALGNLGDRQAVPALLELLRKTGSRDAYVRHATVLALARIGDTNALLSTAFGAPVSGAPAPVRLGVLLALRRLGSPEVARFLSDPDPQLVLEAARAINDVPIPAARPQLASLLRSSRRESAQTSSPARGRDQSGFTSAATEQEFFTLRRALNANFRLGHATNAQALAAFAADSDSPEPLRIEALELLELWPKPPGRDHFTGLWRPLPARDAQPAADALRPVIASLLHVAPKDVKLATLRTANALGVKEANPFALFSDPTQPPDLRVEAFKSLAVQKDPRLAEALALALNDRNESIRIEATRLQAGRLDLAQLGKTLEAGSIAEKQTALAALAAAQNPATGNLIATQLDALLAGSLPRELALDVLEAAAIRPDAAIQDRLRHYTNSLPKDDDLAAWRPVLHGGDAAGGRTAFYENQLIACFRCHKLNGEGGEVGPELTGLAAKRGREFLLESIVFPNKSIAPGFESALITMKNGSEYAGLIKAENAIELELNSPEDGLLKLKTADIAERRRGLSAMPEEMVTVLSRRELRDLIEFLANAK